MKAIDLLNLFQKAGKRTHLVGNLTSGVIIALDMEGRLFTVLNGRVLNRVNPDAISGESINHHYLNPGGDGLWPAPEGTSLGYQYTTGAWRVAPGLRMARYQVSQADANRVTVQSEIDLINNQGLGIPTLFKRQVEVKAGLNSVVVKVLESITYLGNRSLTNTDCLLDPWSLCQFESPPGCVVMFPLESTESVWDLYDHSSENFRRQEDGFCVAATGGPMRYQIGIDQAVPWIEFSNPSLGLIVRRHSDPLPGGFSYIDIRDTDPKSVPTAKGVRYSVYSDSDHFMEIESAGGCPEIIHPNTELSTLVTTEFSITSAY